ncbi:MAG: hypothetical protein AB7K52_14810 [Phycisphaerales bacterium]
MCVELGDVAGESSARDGPSDALDVSLAGFKFDECAAAVERDDEHGHECVGGG